MPPDFAAMAETYARAFPDARAWGAGEIATLAQADGGILIGVPTAFVIGRLVVDEAEVLTIVTHPDHQRQGHARRTLLQFESAIAPKARSVFLEVAADNLPAIALYSRLHYRQIDERRGYYPRPSGGPVNALVLQKSL